MLILVRGLGVDGGEGGLCIGCTQLQRGWNKGLCTIRGGGGGSFGGTAT